MSGSSNALLDAIANPKPVDVAGAYGTANRLAQGIWANRLAQSQQAAGQAALGAIGPDGTFNAQRLNQNLAADPSTAMSAQESMQRGSTNATTDFDLHMKRLTALSNSMGAVSAQNPNGVPLDVANAAVDRELASGQITPQIAQQFKAQLTSDPQQNSRIILQGHIANLTAQEALHASRPSTGTQTGPGGTLQGYQVAPPAAGPGAGAVSSPPQPGAPQGPGADQLSGVSTITDSQGTPHTDTLFGHIQNGRVTGSGAPAPGYSAAPAGGGYSTQPLLGGAKTPVPGSADDLTNPTMPGQTEAAPGDYKVTPPLPRAGPRSGGTTGPAPGVVEGQRKIAEDSAGAFKEISDQGVGAQSRGAVLDNMLSDTGQFSTGPGADIIARVRAIANRLGYNVNTEGLSAAESFKKLAAALNANQGSDARLSVSEASNPHADLSPAGIDLMIRQLRGNEDYTQARAKLAADYPDRKDKIGFEAKVGAQLDPRTFQYDRMTPPQKSTFFKSIDDKDKFIKAHDAATALGAR